VICGGILCSLSFWQTIPWLLLYNLIFILPMLAITAISYLGLATVENVADWKEKNIRYLHLVAGLIILFLGIAMVLGWV
jgi:cytochrome c biogenesis protein CcdA